MTATVRPPELVEALKALHLPTMRSCYGSVAEQARQESLSYEQYLLELVHQEWYTRREHRIARFLRESHLPLEKNLATFDRKRLSAKLQAQLNTLLEGTFLDRAENVLAFGTPGSGKTHLLCAIGQELIYQERRLCFMTCSGIIQFAKPTKAGMMAPNTMIRPCMVVNWLNSSGFTSCRPGWNSSARISSAIETMVSPSVTT